MTPPLFPGADDDPAITYLDITCPHDDDFIYRIYHHSRIVGEIYREKDPIIPDANDFSVHLYEDPRGPIRVRTAAVLHRTTRRLIHTHPLFP